MLRTCLEPLRFPIEWITDGGALEDDLATRRFTSLVETLSQSVPPLPYPSARELAEVVDANLGRWDALEIVNWAGDVASHFTMSSSFARKGRLLTTVARFMRPRSSVEVGTAYGMSAFFILCALEEVGGQLVTLDVSPRSSAIAGDLLIPRFGERVELKVGMSADVLPEIARERPAVDFVFHDAAHTGDAYVNDFGLVVDALAPGAVVLFDDIRWEDPRFQTGASGAYEGWRRIVDHPRVAKAVEIDSACGLALMT